MQSYTSLKLHIRIIMLMVGILYNNFIANATFYMIELTYTHHNANHRNFDRSPWQMQSYTSVKPRMTIIMLLNGIRYDKSMANAKLHVIEATYTNHNGVGGNSL